MDLLSLSGLFLRLWLIRIWLRIWTFVIWGRGEKAQCNYLVSSFWGDFWPICAWMLVTCLRICIKKIEDNRVVFMPRVFSNKLPFCLGCGLGRGSPENLGWPRSVLIVKTGSYSLSPSSPASEAEGELKTLLCGKDLGLSSQLCLAVIILEDNIWSPV